MLNNTRVASLIHFGDNHLEKNKKTRLWKN
jgi:hypothetical protein